MTGEGIGRVVVAAVGSGLVAVAWTGFAIAWWRGLRRQIELFPSDDEEDRRAEALVPEFAAARAYKGRCRCAACRNRSAEPCSDFDEN